MTDTGAEGILKRKVCKLDEAIWSYRRATVGTKTTIRGSPDGIEEGGAASLQGKGKKKGNDEGEQYLKLLT